jgi:phosphoribosylanthranilate isomerase
MVRVKVCGVTNVPDLEAVERAGADAIGVIADVPVDTPRAVSLETAEELFDAAPLFLTTTLVTMAESIDEATGTADAVDPDVLQLHTDLPPESLRSIGESTAGKLIAVVDAADPDRARAVAPAVDGILVDSIDESGAGGTGETHDWDATSEVAATLDVPVILAGGLTPDNVAAAVETVRPFAVDVATGVERSGGRKDHDAVRSFVANAVDATESDGSGHSRKRGEAQP